MDFRDYKKFYCELAFLRFLLSGCTFDPRARVFFLQPTLTFTIYIFYFATISFESHCSWVVQLGHLYTLILSEYLGTHSYMDLCKESCWA